ncbi:MAG: DNA polymerase III subunit alpha, partial [Mesorhizobium amorphae]
MAGDRMPKDPILRAAQAAREPKPEPKPDGPVFVHLRVHAPYSLLEGALPVGKIVGHAVKDEAPAIAITDTSNMFGALEFAQKASKEGVQPLVGAQVEICFPSNQGNGKPLRKEKPDCRPIILIAATEEG